MHSTHRLTNRVSSRQWDDSRIIVVPSAIIMRLPCFAKRNGGMGEPYQGVPPSFFLHFARIAARILMTSVIQEDTLFLRWFSMKCPRFSPDLLLSCVSHKIVCQKSQDITKKQISRTRLNPLKYCDNAGQMSKSKVRFRHIANRCNIITECSNIIPFHSVSLLL